MTGFPPLQDKAVIFADGSFHKFPQLAGMSAPLVLRQLKALMQASSGPHDERFWERYEDLRASCAAPRSRRPTNRRLRLHPDYIPPPSDRYYRKPKPASAWAA
jgi:hypothetical protein